MSSNIDFLKFDSKGLVPVVAQEVRSGDILMFAYANREAIERTLTTGKSYYFSRSRDSLWLKGKTSGNKQQVVGISYDCDGDALIYHVKQSGNACHTGEYSCFFRTISGSPFRNGTLRILIDLEDILASRIGADPKESYVASLLTKGASAICEKIEEEAREVSEALQASSKEQVVHEIADLWFHSLIGLALKKISIEEIFQELQKRFGVSGHKEKQQRWRGVHE